METITMRELIERTGAMRETLRCKIRAKMIQHIGYQGVSRYRTSVYRLDDVKFLFDIDFSRYKKEQSFSRNVLDYPFNNTGVRALIRAGGFNVR